jgi:hypothetical protein
MLNKKTPNQLKLSQRAKRLKGKLLRKRRLISHLPLPSPRQIKVSRRRLLKKIRLNPRVKKERKQHKQLKMTGSTSETV